MKRVAVVALAVALSAGCGSSGDSPADVTVTPNSSSMLAAVDGADVVNIDLGELCGAQPQHPDLPRDPMVMSQVLFGLTREAGQEADSSTCVEPVRG